MKQIFFNTLPVSTNKLFRGGRRFRTKDYDRYEKELIAQIPRPITTEVGDIEVTVEAYLPKVVYARLDVDNILKGLLDSCTHAGLWEDDSHIVSLHVHKYKITTKKEMGLRLTVTPA